MSDSKPVLNRRKDDRYPVRGIRLGAHGEFSDMSRWGFRLKKASAAPFTEPELRLKFIHPDLVATPVWQDNQSVGFRCSHPVDDLRFLVQHARHPKTEAIKPQMRIREEALAADPDMRRYSTPMDYMVRLDLAGANTKRLLTCIHDITQAFGGPSPLEGEEKPEETLTGSTGVGDSAESSPPQERTPDLMTEIIERAQQESHEHLVEVRDIDFAIARLGETDATEIARDFLRRQTFENTTAMSGYEGFSTLRSVLMSRLQDLLGQTSGRGRSAYLVSVETAGADVLTAESSGLLDGFYNSPHRLYSEVSRILEAGLFGTDLFKVNAEIYSRQENLSDEQISGYFVGHQTLHPRLTLDKTIRISLTKENLAFAYLVYLLDLAILFVDTRDKEYGMAFVNRLKGKGIAQNQAERLLEEACQYAGQILQQFNVDRRPRCPSPPSSGVSLDRLLPKDSSCQYLMDTFRSCQRLGLRRMALRYEDGEFAHGLLSKILDSDAFGFQSKSLWVIPAENLSEEASMYFEDFSDCEMLVFKDIDRIPKARLADFAKLWSDFEGCILVTFSAFRFLDYSFQPLHAILKSVIVDFPSYSRSPALYEKMLEQARLLLDPFIGSDGVSFEPFKNDTYSMEHVLAHLLQSHELKN